MEPVLKAEGSRDAVPLFFALDAVYLKLIIFSNGYENYHRKPTGAYGRKIGSLGGKIAAESILVS